MNIIILYYYFIYGDVIFMQIERNEQYNNIMRTIRSSDGPKSLKRLNDVHIIIHTRLRTHHPRVVDQSHLKIDIFR